MANQRWSTGDVQSYAEEYLTPVVSCLIYWAMSEWHFGEIASCHETGRSDLNSKGTKGYELISHGVRVGSESRWGRAQSCRRIGGITGLANDLRLKAEALYLANRTFEALEALKEAEAILKRTGEGNWRA